MLKNIKYLSLLLIASLLVAACAKQVVISGGAKDITPPQVKKSTPENASLNFSTKNINIKFDEFIKLNDVSQKLIVSPPLETKPTTVVSGKNLKITLNQDELKPNTTYCLNFNDAIADNNENNAINSFVYAFSTGSEIDSLTISGHILDAFTKKPVEDVWVLLHNNLSDTAISNCLPSYITKVDKKGNFSIPYIHEADYKIYALRDNNTNFMFDLPEEEIAFLDTLFRPAVEEKISEQGDSITKTYLKTPSEVELLLFRENKTPQFISSFKRLKRNYFEMVFNFTQYEKYKFTVPRDTSIFVWAKENPDTVFLWLKDSTMIASDTLRIFAEYTDPAFPDSIRYDTLKYRKQDKLLKDSSLILSLSKIKEPHEDYYINFSAPLENFDTSKVSLFVYKDTICIKQNFEIEKDSLSPLRLKIIADFVEKEKYKVKVDSAFAISIYGHKSKRDSVEFISAPTSDYGNLKISFNDSTQYVIQLLSNEKVLYQKSSEKGIVSFSYLLPGKYVIRTIVDSNNNKRWDTGDFTKHLQSEKVFYYPNEYEIRSSWDHEITWDVKN